MARSEKQFFSMRDGVLHYQETPIQESSIFEEAKSLIDKLTIPHQTQEMHYLSLIFCISSQRQNFEVTINLIRDLMKVTEPIPQGELKDEFADEVPKNLEFVTRRARQHGVRWGYVKGDNRLEPIYDYINHYGDLGYGNIAELVADFRNNPISMREQLVKDVKWIAHKTASFWYLCLGGQELMTLDIHNYRQIAGLGISIPETFYKGERRPNGKKEIKSSSKKEYVRIEQETLELLDGQVTGAQATSLFWLAGAKATRNMNLYQQDLFEDPVLPFESPFK